MEKMESKDIPQVLTDVEKIKLLELNNRVLFLQNQMMRVDKELIITAQTAEAVTSGILKDHECDESWTIDQNYNIVPKGKVI